MVRIGRSKLLGAQPSRQLALVDSAVIAFDLVNPPLSAEERERYYQESRLFAAFFGIPRPHLPQSWPAFEDYFNQTVGSNVIGLSHQDIEASGAMNTQQILAEMRLGGQHDQHQSPVHEGHRGARIAQVQRRRVRSRRVRRAEQFEPSRRTVADLGDALRGDRRGREATRRTSALSGTLPVSPG